MFTKRQMLIVSLLLTLLGVSQIRHLHIYPCGSADISFAGGLRSNVENGPETPICTTPNPYESYTTNILPNIRLTPSNQPARMMLKHYGKAKSAKKILPPRRAHSSLDVTKNYQNATDASSSFVDNTANSYTTKAINSMPRITPFNTKKLGYIDSGIAKRSKKINSIYDVLKEINNEADFSSIPLRKRKKKWIRTIHDLL